MTTGSGDRPSPATADRADRLGDLGRTAVAYHAFASMYDRYWGDVTVRSFLPAYDRLLLGDLAPRDAVLDVCCGTGRLAGVLAQRGHRVSGVDASVAMLRHARRNAPRANLVAADARSFSVAGPHAAAVATFDSLNHILRAEDLESVFRNVRRALVPGGRFAFDVNMEEGYVERWGDSFGYVGDDHALIVRTGYDPDEGLASFDVTIFRWLGEWQRSDLSMRQRPYPAEVILGALRRSGFGEIGYYDAESDLGVDDAFGRAFFVCRRIER